MPRVGLRAWSASYHKVQNSNHDINIVQDFMSGKPVMMLYHSIK